MPPHTLGRGDAPEDPPGVAPQTIGAAFIRSRGGLSNPAAATAVVVLGAATYALLRAISDQFYAPLGLSPEEIGVGQAELVAQAVGAFLASLVLAGLLLWLLILIVGLGQLGGPLMKVTRMVERTRFGWVAVLAFLPLVAIAFRIEPLVPVTLFGALLLVLGVARLWNTPMSVGVVRTLGATVVLAMLSGTVVLVLTARFHGIWSATGKACSGSIGTRCHGRRMWSKCAGSASRNLAPPPSSCPPPPNELRCGVYLGAKDGLVVLVNPRDDTTVRLPAEQVILTTFTQTDDRYPVAPTPASSGSRTKRAMAESWSESRTTARTRTRRAATLPAATSSGTRGKPV